MLRNKKGTYNDITIYSNYLLLIVDFLWKWKASQNLNLGFQQCVYSQSQTKYNYNVCNTTPVSLSFIPVKLHPLDAT